MYVQALLRLRRVTEEKNIPFTEMVVLYLNF